MSPRISIDLSHGVWGALLARQRVTGESMSALVEQGLIEALDIEGHTLFQVSTSSALVQGVFSQVTTVGQLKGHGDFGLGTFEGLDGEMVLLDGACYRATAGGRVTTPTDDAGVPFAVVTRFSGDSSVHVGAVGSWDDLIDHLDRLRQSENTFIAIRVDGRFESIAMRAACPARPGEGLVEATKHQSEFSAGAVTGSLVGFWAPEYATSVNVPGYHFHFISTDRATGGHVLDLSGSEVEVRTQVESELHIAIPATVEFMEADLRGDHGAALHEAETKSTQRPEGADGKP